MITVKLYTYHPNYPELRAVTGRFDLCALWRSVRSAWSGLLAPLIIVLKPTLCILKTSNCSVLWRTWRRGLAVRT